MAEIVTFPERHLLLRIVDRVAEATLYACISVMWAFAISTWLGG